MTINYPATSIGIIKAVLLSAYFIALAVSAFEGLGDAYRVFALFLGLSAACVFTGARSNNAGSGRFTYVVIAIALILVPVLCSQIINIHALEINDLLVGAVFCVTILTCALIGMNASNEELWTAFDLTSISFFSILVACLFMGTTDESGRLNGFNGNMHPNYVGLMAIVAACMILNQRLVLVSILTLLALSTCYLASSRGSLLVIVVCYVSNIVCRFSYKRLELRDAVVLSLGVIASILVIALYSSALYQFVCSDILLLDNKYRGVDSGASGRGEVWDFLIKVWLSNPFFGEGYSYTSNRLEFSDGGYLLTLAETGIVGLLGMLIFLIVGAYKSWKLGYRVDEGRRRAASVAILIGFMVVNIFESRFQSGANPLSSCIYIICFGCWSEKT